MIDHVLQHEIEYKGELRWQYLLCSEFMALDHMAVLVYHCGNSVWSYPESLVGEDRIGIRDLHWGDIDSPQHDRRIRR
jgi:hypothetical protein